MTKKQTSPSNARKALTKIEADSNSYARMVETSNLALSLPIVEPKDNVREGQLSLFSPTPSPLPLKAYLACALSNLGEEERALLFSISDVVAELCKEADVELYQPRLHTDPKIHMTVSSDDVYETDTNRVLTSDVVIHLCHQPSTGAGEELELARAALIPMILIYPDHLKVSRMVLGIPGLIVHIAYREIDDLQSQLTNALFDFRPLFEERKLTTGGYKVNVIGEKIREIRQKIQLTREEVAEATHQAITVKRLKVIEEKTDMESNPSLLELRKIAMILKTTVSEIVEPSLLQQIFIALKNWTEGREAARTSISQEDQKRIVKAMMHRMADWI